jgi:hypothetical protein
MKGAVWLVHHPSQLLERTLTASAVGLRGQRWRLVDRPQVALRVQDLDPLAARASAVHLDDLPGDELERTFSRPAPVDERATFGDCDSVTLPAQ